MNQQSFLLLDLPVFDAAQSKEVATDKLYDDGDFFNTSCIDFEI